MGAWRDPGVGVDQTSAPSMPAGVRAEGRGCHSAAWAMPVNRGFRLLAPDEKDAIEDNWAYPDALWWDRADQTG